MAIKDYVKLVKLIIENTETKEVFQVMFNPESYTETFSNVYRKKEDVNTGMEEYVYVKTMPQDFKLKIIIDGTGVTNYRSTVFPVFKNSEKSVYEQVNEFLKLAWYPEEGRAKPLLIKWGDFSYHCFLKDVTINYTLFDREGRALRAELDAVFISNPEQITQQLKRRFEQKSDQSRGSASAPVAPKTEQVGRVQNQGGLSSNGIVISVS
jgi:hypothetical protein